MLCSAVSYFSTRVGSIIGADRLSFRVRDGTGRFPVAISAVTLFSFSLRVDLSPLGGPPGVTTFVFGGGVWVFKYFVVWLRATHVCFFVL